MKAYQEAKLNMYRVTEQHCDENPSIISQTPAFQTAFTNFKGKIQELLDTTQLADTALEGITVGKTDAKLELAQIAADIAGIIYAYASVEGNEQLKEEVNYAYSILSRTKDDELAPRCNIILARGTTNLVALADYGINQDKLDDLERAINAYSADVPKPRTAKSNRKTQNANIRRIITEADEILKEQMDKLVVTFKAANPDFVETYFNARIIIDPATTTTELKGTITNQSDGSPVNNATVEIVELSRSTTSNSTGNYQFKPVNNGDFTVRVTASGFQEFQADDVEVKLGVINRLDVELINN